MNQSTSSRETLKHIATTTRNFRAKFPLPRHHQHPPPAVPVPCIPSLRLEACIVEFKTQLIQHDVHPQISSIAITNITQVEKVYQHSFSKTCSAMLPLLNEGTSKTPLNTIQSLQSRFEQRFRTRELPPLMEKILHINSSVPRTHSISFPKDERKAFNHEWTPVLEKYFSRNAYPSSADKNALARETNMTPRQIEVWFQNHRNRGKKDGVVLKRETRSLISPPPESYTTAALALPDRSRNSVPVNINGHSLSAVPRASQVSAPFPCSALTSNKAPAHAFPTPYPPKCVEDPFPNVNGCFKFPPPIWLRVPCSQTSSSDVLNLNIDQLCSDFAQKLSFYHHGPVSPLRRSRTVSPPSEETTSWHHTTTIIPCVAPLPALNSTPECPPARSCKKPHFPMRRPGRSQPAAFIPWANSAATLYSASRTPSLVSNTSRTVSTSSISTSNSSCDTTPPLSPANSERNFPQDIKGLLSHDFSISSYFDFDTYAPSLPHLLRQYTPSLDQIFPHYPLPIQASS